MLSFKTAAVGLLASLASATSAHATPRVVDATPAGLAAKGIQLAPGEQNAAVVVVGGARTEDTISVSDGTTDGPTVGLGADGAATTSDRRTVYVLGDDASAKSKTVHVDAVASRAVTVRSVGASGDYMCGNYGCWSWKMTLSSLAYYDGSYAWGDRSRYGYAGYANCGASGTGFAMTRQECRFWGDPSPSSLYASAQYQVSGVVSGSPISTTHYLHRHYNKDGGSWLVAN